MFRRPTAGRASGLGSRRGYSLLELLIVLGILASIAALTLPALRGPLDRSRLRGAGRKMQTSLAKARSLAIRSGKEHWLRFQIDGTAWRIETSSDDDPELEESTGVSATSSLLGEPETAADSTEKLVREGDLPSGVAFSQSPETAQPLDDPRAGGSDRTVELLQQLAAENSGEANRKRWSEPIRFSPNGRTGDATILISGAGDFVTEVTLRGLTGATTSRTFRQVATEPLDDLLKRDQPGDNASEQLR